MPASVTPMPNPNPPRRGGRGGDDRAGLRAAIEAAAEAKSDRAAHGRAIERASRILSDAERRVGQSAAAITSAKLDYTNLVARAAATDDGDLSTGAALVRTARRAEAEAADALEAARTALAKLRADVLEVEDAAAVAENEVSAAINGLLAPVAERSLAEAERLQATLASHLAVLLAVMEAGTERVRAADAVREGRMQKAREAPLADVRGRISKFLVSMADVRSRDAAVAGWRRAREALRLDPDAPLPT